MNDSGFPTPDWPKPKAAAWYAQQGWRLVPLHDVTGGACSCKTGGNPDCKDAGKHPRNINGVRGASADPSVVAGWWEVWPEANIGIATGRPFAFVVDEDTVDALRDTWPDEFAAARLATDGPCQVTPRGVHWLFDATDDLGSSTGGRGRSLGAGIDTRGDGGYIVACPSVTPAGAYRWRSDPRGPWPVLPEPMLVALRPEPLSRTVEPGNYPSGDAEADSRIERYVAAAVQAARRELEQAPEGTRNHTLNEVAFRLGTLGAHGVLTEEDAWTELRDVWSRLWLPEPLTPDGAASFAKTFSSGWNAGLAKPREPWPPPAREEPTGAGLGFAGPAAEAPADPLAVLRARLVDSAGLDDIPEPDPLIPGVLYRDSIAWVYGAPGCGKSFVSLDLSGAVGTGSHWQASGLAARGDVIYLVAEGVRGIRRRVRAWESANDLKMTGVSFLPVAVQAASHAEWSVFVALAAERRPAMVVIDTQARVTVGMDENSAQDMGVFVERVEQLRQASGACVLVVHHTGRAGEHMRGSIALDGAATTLIAVEKSDELVSLRCAKQKDEDEFAVIRLALTPHEDSAVLIPATGGGVGAASWLIRWWDHFGAGATSKSDLLAALDVQPSTFFARIKPHVKAGRIVRELRGRSAYYSLRIDPQGPLPDAGGLGFGNRPD